ncbi:MAG: FKBP-type peptidyl-prolyl cis-trans isomerase [Pseudomonadota bacterium]
MKLGVGILFAAILLAAPAYAEEQPILKSEKQKESYIIGLEIGRSLKNLAPYVDLDALLLGMKDVFAGNPLLLPEAEARKLAAAFSADKDKTAIEKDLKLGEEFLAENRKKEGVVVLPSGLQYKVLTEGTGKSPKRTDTVTVHYRGTLMDGREFASSYVQGQPSTFRVNDIPLIPGLTEVLPLMKEGSKWQIFIPPNLASVKRSIWGYPDPLHSVLIYVVEMISVKETPRGK